MCSCGVAPGVGPDGHGAPDRSVKGSFVGNFYGLFFLSMPVRYHNYQKIGMFGSCLCIHCVVGCATQGAIWLVKILYAGESMLPFFASPFTRMRSNSKTHLKC